MHEEIEKKVRELIDLLEYTERHKFLSGMMNAYYHQQQVRYERFNGLDDYLYRHAQFRENKYEQKLWVNVDDFLSALCDQWNFPHGIIEGFVDRLEGQERESNWEQNMAWEIQEAVEDFEEREKEK